MNSRVLLSVVLLSAATSVASAAESFPPHVIPNSQLRVLPVTAAGRHYQLHVGLPESYAKSPAKKYPVVYVTDGYWDFQKITSSEGSLVYDQAVPEFITVGIGYAGENLNYGDMRTWELSPVPMRENDSSSGHAAEFLQTIETAIIPFMEREYRADPSYRVMAGASLGGLFTLYAMYTKPELFKGYIAATPAVVVGNDWLLSYEEKFAATKRPLNVRLFASGGGAESPDFLGGIKRFGQRLAKRNYPGLQYEFRIVEGERHAGVQQESYSRGLRWVFAPLAPSPNPDPIR